MDFVKESFAIAPVRAAPSERLARILTRLALCEQINRNERKQKIRNKHRSSSVILGHPLAKE
jgi:hypothetical protein